MNFNKMKKEDLVKEIISLREKVGECSANLDELTRRSEELSLLNKEKDSAIDNLKNKVSELDELVKDKEGEILTLNESIEQYRSNVHEQTKELQTVRKQMTSVRDDAQGMESKIAELNLANSRLKVWKYIAVAAIVAFCCCLCVIVA